MEEVVFADKEYASELLIIVGHHNVLCRPLAEAQERVDIFNAPESFLPQLEFYGHVQLLESGVEMTLQGIRVAEIDSVHL